MCVLCSDLIIHNYKVMGYEILIENLGAYLPQSGETVYGCLVNRKGIVFSRSLIYHH